MGLLLKSKTIWGAVLAILGWLFSPDTLGVMPETVAAIMQAIGSLLAAIGLRGAVAKSGPEGSQLKHP